MKVDVLGHAKVLMTPGRVLRALKTQIDTRSATSHHGALELLTGVNINDWLLGMVWGALPPQFASYLKLTIAVLVTGVGPWLAGAHLLSDCRRSSVASCTQRSRWNMKNGFRNCRF